MQEASIDTKIAVGNYPEFLLLMNRVYETIEKYGYQTTDFIAYSNNKWVKISSPSQDDIIKKLLDEWTFTAQAEFRTISSMLNIAFTDDMSRVIAILNNFLPRMSEYTQSEMENYRILEKTGDESVVDSNDLLDMLAQEDASYTRRLIASALNISTYASGMKNLPNEVINEMEEISLSSVTKFNKYEEEIALRSIVSIGSDSQRTKPFETKVLRYDFIKNNIPLLTSLANFDRKNGDNMARFMINIPTVMTWTVGGKNGHMLPTMVTDACMDIFHNSVMVNRLMSVYSDRATQLRFRLSHGYPEYREFLKLMRDTDSLFTWTVEGMLFRISDILPAIIKGIDPKEKGRLVKWLTVSGVLGKYAEHKGVHIKRS